MAPTATLAPSPGSRPVVAGDRTGAPGPPLYGLDIETDTSVDGLDPRRSAIVAVGVSATPVVPPGADIPTPSPVDRVFDGDEATILTRLDAHLRALPAGILVTWNGAAFDLPFIADRARRHGLRLGLHLRSDPGARRRRPSLAGHDAAYRARWYHHDHLDAYRLYRADVGATLGLACGLKPLARFVGLPVVEVDRSRIHELDTSERHDYVLSDARLALTLALRREATARRAVDARARPT